MKLNLFLIILGVLLLSCLGSNIKESFDGLGDSDTTYATRGASMSNGDDDNSGPNGNRHHGNRHHGNRHHGNHPNDNNPYGNHDDDVRRQRRRRRRRKRRKEYARTHGTDIGGDGELGPEWTWNDDVPASSGVPQNYNNGYSVTEEELPTSPPQDDNRWILRSQIVPPVCPKCPNIRTCEKTPCPACPPCGRCPEPAFRCEKVPNYNSRNDMYMPRPVLADFSQFAM